MLVEHHLSSMRRLLEYGGGILIVALTTISVFAMGVGGARGESGLNKF